ncbi:MAG: hypothetical protein ACYTFK_10785 [Planctomycetota bacterium]|jgi:hypothetical protein
MNRLIWHILLAGTALWASGCEPQRQKYQGPIIEGITIDDLAPATAMKLPPQINFQIYLFEVAAQNVPEPKELLLGLTRKTLHFTDDSAFEENGFLAGFGRGEMWNEISARLTKIRAKNIGTRRLIVFDDKGDDIVFSTLTGEKTVFYTTSQGELTGASLGPGNLAWRIKAKPVAGVRGAAQVQIQPVFKSPVSDTIAKVLDQQGAYDTVFDVAEFELTMSSGDFVLLGPARLESDDITLGNLFFASRGNFAFEISKQDKNAEEPSRPSYTLRKDVPLIRFFLVACTRVGD